MAAVTNSASGGSSASKTKSKSSKGKLLNLGELLKDYSSVNWAEEMEQETKLSASISATTGVTTVDQRVNIVATRSALPTAPKAARGDTDGPDSRGAWQSAHHDQRREYDGGGGYSQRFGRDQQQQRPSYARGIYSNRGGGPGGYERSTLPPPQSDRGAPYQSDREAPNQTDRRAPNQTDRGAPNQTDRGAPNQTDRGALNQTDRGALYGHPYQQNNYEYKQEYDSGTYSRRHDRDRPPMHRGGYNRGSGANHDAMPPPDYRNNYAPPYPQNNYEYRHENDGLNYPPPQRMSSREPPQQRYYDENRGGGANSNRRSQPPPDNFVRDPPPQQRFNSLRRVSHRVSTTSSVDDQRSEDLEASKTRPHLQLLPRTKPLSNERVVLPPPPADAPSKAAIFGDAKPVDTRIREQEVEERYLRAKQEVLTTEKKQPSISESYHPEKPHHYNAPYHKFVPPRQQRTLSGSSARSSPIEDPRPSQQNAQMYQRPPEDPMTRSEISVRPSTDKDTKLQLGQVTIMRRSTTEKAEEKEEERELKSSDAEKISVEVAVSTKLEKSITMPNVSDHARGQEAQNEITEKNESDDSNPRRRSEIEVSISKQRRDSTSSFKSGGSRGGGNSNFRNRGQPPRSRDDSDATSLAFRHGSRVPLNFNATYALFTRGGGYQNYDSADICTSPARSTASYNNGNAWGQRGGASRGRGRGGGGRFHDRSSDRCGSGDVTRRNYNRQQPSDRRETVDSDGFKNPHLRHDKRYSNTGQQRSTIGQKESSAPPALNENVVAATAVPKNSSRQTSNFEDTTPSSDKVKEEKTSPPSLSSTSATSNANMTVKASAATTEIKEAKAAAATVVTAAAAAAAATKPPPSSSRKSAQQKKKSNDKKKIENDKSTSFTAANKYHILGELQE